MASLVNTTYMVAGSSFPYLTQAEYEELTFSYSFSPNDFPSPRQTVFDKAAYYDDDKSVFYAFEATVPSNEDLKAALSKVLLHYPHLLGMFTQIDNRICFFLINWGARITETFSETTLAEQLPFNPLSREVRQLLPPEGHGEFLQIQLNRYSCGGLVIGATYHPRVADAQSMSSFFVAWARVVRGLDIDPLPYHDRDAVCQPRKPLKVEFDHRSIEFNTSIMTPVDSPSIETIVINYSSEFIDKLKAKVLDEDSCDSQQKLSTFECLLSHTWKKVTQARGLGLEVSTQVRIAVDGRTRIEPAVPMEYFGNLVLWARPSLKVEEVLQKTRAYVARAIHDEVGRINSSYFKSFIDFGEEADGKESPDKESPEEHKELDATWYPYFGNTLCPNLEVENWLGYPFRDLDFGGGSPCAFFPVPKIQTEGFINFLPSCDGDGGAVVVLSLLPEHVEVFNQISHSLDD
ncbi:hypothetical protein MKW94_008385 [Papaver nudicaule]|uniref:Uncharacterized protein n=1 Tax=Papaver nudicaule TaxID=74823 RepID=A0AA41V4D8_PAPNU|nr:hypothetical protein [Papaver nudicaule]